MAQNTDPTNTPTTRKMPARALCSNEQERIDRMTRAARMSMSAALGYDQEDTDQ